MLCIRSSLKFLRRGFFIQLRHVCFYVVIVLKDFEVKIKS